MLKETVNSQNSATHSQPANAGACAFLPEQEATNLGSEEYNEVVLSVGDAVDANKNLLSKRKRGNYYNHYSPELCAQIGKYASENGNRRALNHFKAQLPNLQTIISEETEGNEETRNTRKRDFYSTRHPSLLVDLAQKLILLLKSIRNRGGVDNFNVVKTSA